MKKNPSKKPVAETPKPCPFCKSTKVGVDILDPVENDRAVTCDSCGKTGPIARQHYLAIEYWNKET